MATSLRIDVIGDHPRVDRLREMARAAGFHAEQSVWALFSTHKEAYHVWMGTNPPSKDHVHIWCRDGWENDLWKDIDSAREFCSKLGLDYMVLHEMENSPGLPSQHIAVMPDGRIRAFQSENESLRHIVEEAARHCDSNGSVGE